MTIAQKMKLGCHLLGFDALPTAAIHFKPVAAQLKAMPGGGVEQDILDVASSEILGGTTVNAKQVVVVAVMAQLVVQVSIFQQHPAEPRRLPPEFSGCGKRWRAPV